MKIDKFVDGLNLLYKTIQEWTNILDKQEETKSLCDRLHASLFSSEVNQKLNSHGLNRNRIIKALKAPWTFKSSGGTLCTTSWLKLFSVNSSSMFAQNTLEVIHKTLEGAQLWPTCVESSHRRIHEKEKKDGATLR